MKFIKNLIASLALSSLLVAPALVLAPAVASAQAQSPSIQTGLCSGSNLTASDPTNCDPQASAGEATSTVNTIITTVINIFSLVVGVVSVIMIIIGGLKYITSGGDSGNVSGAKNTILYAIVGLVVVALAQIIVQFVLGKVAST